MELGNKIAQLRQKANWTQKQLADTLGISAQSVSKWETSQSMPDITLLPQIAEAFGISIDDLFDLTTEQRLNRIENRMDLEDEFTFPVFCEYEEYLKSLLEDEENKYRATSLLAHLYGHRMFADAKRVRKYAEAAIRMDPSKKDCQWLLSEFDGHANWDWNIDNHKRAIEFYKEIIHDHPKTLLPYYYLLDNLIADHRMDEAEKALDEFAKLNDKNPAMTDIYRVYIVLGLEGSEKADAAMDALKGKYGNDDTYLFEAAQYYAKRGQYDKTIEYYELSWSTDPRKPRYIDAPQAIADICEIKADYRGAAEAYDRIVRCLKEEWGMKEETALKEAEAKREALLRKAS